MFKLHVFIIQIKDTQLWVQFICNFSNALLHLNIESSFVYEDGMFIINIQFIGGFCNFLIKKIRN